MLHTPPTRGCKDMCRASRQTMPCLHSGTQEFPGNKRRPKGPEMTSAPGPVIRLNGVRYCWPDRPIVVVCNDGGVPTYFDRALKEGMRTTYRPSTAMRCAPMVAK